MEHPTPARDDSDPFGTGAPEPGPDVTVGPPWPDAAPSDAAHPDTAHPDTAHPGARSVTLSISMLVAAVLFAVLAVVPAPYVVSSPGPTRDTLGDEGGTPLISITGAPTYPSTGQLRLTTVSATGGPGYPSTVLGVVRGWFDSTSAVQPVEALYPPDVSKDQVTKANQAQMTSSQEDATVAALEELGYDVPATLTVAGTTPGSGADGALRVDDVIVTMDGTPLTSFTQLTDALKATAAGATVRLGVKRAGSTIDVDVVTTERAGGGAQLGVLINPTFSPPIDVKIKIEDIGGPSAGTMFALGIIDKLTPQDEANGQVIAGTGTMDISGDVGPIGGIRQKLVGARRDGATWFLAPADDCSEVVGHVPDGLRVVRIATLHEAREAIIAIGAGAGDSLATCTAG
ncbi:MAG: PDZ domain-containing protein [Cellulomonas sp.]